MSLGYADKLSFREDLGGRLGDPEIFDEEPELNRKIDELAKLVQQAERIVAFTGAGISTSCGIPDFRGPQGIWTLKQAGLPLPPTTVCFAHAKPSVTHQALLALMLSGKLTFIVSQNVDGLHLRSGVPRDQIAELHGNCFAETCSRCGTEYVRDFEVETVGFKFTGRKCSTPGCSTKLRDQVLDWEDKLPDGELIAADHHSKWADLAICLGTSLQITPACNIPLRTIKTYKDKAVGGKLSIINLQSTKHDNKAEKSGGVVIHGKTDIVMGRLMQKLGMDLPQYIREDTVHVGHVQHRRKDSSKVPVTIFVRSSHGPKAACLPMVESVEFHFEDPRIPNGTLVTSSGPFSMKRTINEPGAIRLKVTLKLHDAADEDKRTVSVDYTADLALEDPNETEHYKEVKFVSQVVSYEIPTSDAAQETLHANTSKNVEDAPNKRARVD